MQVCPIIAKSWKSRWISYQKHHFSVGAAMQLVSLLDSVMTLVPSHEMLTAICELRPWAVLCYNKMVFSWFLQNKWFEVEIMTWGQFFFEPSFFSWSQNIWLGEIISVRLCIRTFNGGFPFHFWIALQLCWQNQMEILDTQNPTKLVKLNQTFLSWLHSGEVFWTKILQWMPGLCGFCPQGLLMLLGNSQC